MMQAFALVGPLLQVFPLGPRFAKFAGNPALGYAAEYSAFAVAIARTDPTAEASFAAILLLTNFGIAIAARMSKIPTTISSSIREKPFWLFMESSSCGSLEVPVP